MCGIIGYVGNKKTIPILLDGLKSLEYRGYDSAGVAFRINDEIKIIKSIGKINNLEKILDNQIESYMGIGHTRWATHGSVNLNNSHPHTQCSITIVHNGIIENYLDIKKKLVNLGYRFKSDTDSEVLAGLIDYYYKKYNDEIKCLEDVQKKIQGSYALGIIFNNDIDCIYAMRKDSPLIIGIGNNENFIASDMPAIVKYTDKYILLDALEIAKINKNGYMIYKDNKLINKEILTYDYDVGNTDLCGFSHYMLKEIYEESNLIRNNLVSNLNDIPDINKYKNIYIVGCGSAYHAGLIGSYLIEEYACKSVKVDIASEFRYRKLFLDKDDLVILISQSGETADTLASLRIAREYGAKTLGIVNVYGSSIARECNIVLYTNALTEIAVATTKAYVMQVFMLGLIAIKASKLNYEELMPEYKKLANQIEMILDSYEYEEIAHEVYQNHDIFFLGRGIDYAISMEGSLKLKEISYIHSEAYPAGELKHGTISLIDKDIPVISIITNNKIKDKILSNIKEVISRGAKSYVICTDDIDISDEYGKIIKVPSNIDILKPILAVIPLQLIAYYVAFLNGRDIDKPRNLAKSVTVE